MKENRIYFNACVKSFNITRWTTSNGTWYEGVERNRKMMIRTTLSTNTMRWICNILKEASRDGENTIRRWKTKEKLAGFFCIRKFNVYGRYMCILSLQGNERSVLIIPELTLNAGWNDIAVKIERFIKRSTS